MPHSAHVAQKVGLWGLHFNRWDSEISIHVDLEPSKGCLLPCFFPEQMIIHDSWPHPGFVSYTCIIMYLYIELQLWLPFSTCMCSIVFAYTLLLVIIFLIIIIITYQKWGVRGRFSIAIQWSWWWQQRNWWTSSLGWKVFTQTLHWTSQWWCMWHIVLW